MKINLTTNIVTPYDKIIKQHPLLSREEEYILFCELHWVKKQILSHLFKNSSIFSAFKEIVSENYSKNSIFEVFLINFNCFEEGTSSEEVLEYYNNVIIDILYNPRNTNSYCYFQLTDITFKTFNLLIESASNEQLNNYEIKHLMELKRIIVEKITNHNTSMAIGIALNSLSRVKTNIKDTCQNAMVGLLNAIDKHNPFINIKFSTTAFNWITQNIRRIDDNTSDLIAIPCNKKEEARASNKIYNDFVKKNGRNPSIDELRELTGNDSFYINNQTCHSLDEPIRTLNGSSKGDMDTPLEGLLKDENATYEHNVEFDELKDKIDSIISRLDDRNKKLVKMMFGYEGETYSNKQIMSELNLDLYSFNKLRSKLFKEIKDEMEEDSTFNFWQEVVEDNI